MSCRHNRKERWLVAIGEFELHLVISNKLLSYLVIVYSAFVFDVVLLGLLTNSVHGWITNGDPKGSKVVVIFFSCFTIGLLVHLATGMIAAGLRNRRFREVGPTR